MSCRACGNTLVAGIDTCPRCGSPVAPSAPARLVTPPDDLLPTGFGAAIGSLPRTLSAMRGSFPAGTILAGRYRIIARIGRGGMGDVYRADDLTLDQPVALKFLPADVVADPARLERFRAEVKLARQVSHPNVCRVHDIGAADGHTFLTMEHIEGENLAALLRRIGRLPLDTAADMARQLCAGLAAVHDKHVLHRDLKPANVMIDGDGQVKLADFGLASVAHDGPDGAVAGTPAYIAPELFERQPPSIRSDIYALGLVLFEMFAGKPAFTAATLDDYQRLHRDTQPAGLATLVPDVDRRVDAIVRRCLAKEPHDRPANALTVASVLPGADPLAAALAAGQTPSPELVASAGAIGTIRPSLGLVALAIIAVCLAATVGLSRKVQAIQYVPLDKAPEVLADRARSVLHRLGFANTAPGVASGFRRVGYLAYLREHINAADRWERLRIGRPSEYVFWYRTSPRAVVSDRLFLAGRVTATDPPFNVPGMVTVMLDGRGRLFHLAAVPEAGGSAPTERVEWSALFEEAGLPEDRFTPTAPTRVPPVYVDTRAAWQGTYAENPDLAVRIEAGAVAGRPTFFRIYHPWESSDDANAGTGVGGILVAWILVLAAAIVLARRNLRAGRGDTEGATRLALTLAAMHFIAGLLHALYRLDLDVFLTAVSVLFASGLALGAVAWVGYLAFEPDLRRRAPELLISWRRLLSGRFTDPLVGRDVLIGLTMGMVLQLIFQLKLLSPTWSGKPPDLTMPLGGAPATRLSETVALLIGSSLPTVLLATAMGVVFLVLLLLLRRRSWAAIALLAVMCAPPLLGQGPGIPWTLAALSAAVYVIVFTRVSFLAFAVAAFTSLMVDHVPMTVDRTLWYAPQSWLAMLLLLAMASAAYRIAVAPRPMSPWR